MTARDPGFVRALQDCVRGEVRVVPSLGRYSTYRIGGPATVLQPASPEDVGAAVRFAAERGVEIFPLGLGSNVLLPDEGLTALVIRFGKGMDAITPGAAGHWTLGAGAPAPLVARRTAAAGWAGLHTMVGVPGTVGGGVYMNAGCHGGDWASVVHSVTVVDPILGEDRAVPRTDLAFAYRTSGLRDALVVETEVALTTEDPALLEARVAELFAWRQEGTPFNQPCCGSVFRNPARTACSGAAAGAGEGETRTAGQLIEAAGLKGHRLGGIEISSMHANYFVNTGGGTAQEVMTLIRAVRRQVRERFGVLLEPEVRVITAQGRPIPLQEDEEPR